MLTIRISLGYFCCATDNSVKRMRRIKFSSGEEKSQDEMNIRKTDYNSNFTAELIAIDVIK